MSAATVPAADTNAAADAVKKPAETVGAAAVAATAPAATGFFALWGLLLVIPILFMFVFHLGAGYLSYQKYGSFLWAFVDFIFAYFYYPYYAFFLATPAPAPSMFGGKRSVMNLLKMKWK